jgi:hypothetical protein
MHRVPPFTLRVGVVGADRVGCLHDDFDASDNGYLASSTVALSLMARISIGRP